MVVDKRDCKPHNIILGISTTLSSTQQDFTPCHSNYLVDRQSYFWSFVNYITSWRDDASALHGVYEFEAHLEIQAGILAHTHKTPRVRTRQVWSTTCITCVRDYRYIQHDRCQYPEWPASENCCTRGWSTSGQLTFTKADNVCWLWLYMLLNQLAQHYHRSKLTFNITP